MGVLALQGASEAHVAALARLGVRAVSVRRPHELRGLSHLVLPGGESTTLAHLLDLFGLREPLVERFRSGEVTILGTCAGAILLGRTRDQVPETLGLLDAELERNAYGRQVDSFVREVRLSEPAGASLRGVFIRAPRFVRLGAGLRVLATDGDEPVAVEAPGLVATTFHPELSGGTALFERFLSKSPRPAREEAQVR